MLAVSPFASCVLHEDASSAAGLKIWADHRGIVRFFAESQSAVLSANLVLDCQTPGQALTTLIVDPSALASGTALDSAPQSLPIRPALDAHTADTLSQAELVRGGYPPRPGPNQPADALNQWRAMISRPMTILPATGVIDPTRVNYPETDVSVPTWSGPTLMSAFTYGQIQGYWNVPNVLSHGKYIQLNATQYSSMWVGLDGGKLMGGSTDVAQAGTDQNIYYNSNGSPFTTYRSWAEWAPDPETILPAVTAYPGDSMYASVFIGDSSGNYNTSGGYLWFDVANLTRNYQTFGCIGAASSCSSHPTHGQHFVGDTAEWIIERPYVNGQFNPFPNYGTAAMTSAEAWVSNDGYYNGHTYGTDAFNNYSIVSSGNTLSRATEGGGIISFTWVNYF
jgi:hypothetical protein